MVESEEDEKRAADRHELRTFRNGPLDGHVSECWCGIWESEEYLEQAAARRAHERHQRHKIGSDPFV